MIEFSYSSVGVIPRRIKSGLQFLVLDAVRNDGPNAGLKLTKFAGGMGEPDDNGNPEKTLRAETTEETGLTIKPEARIRELLTINENRRHKKFFHLVWRSSCRGKIRILPVADTRSRLGAPYWLSFAELETKICDTHRPVLKVLRELRLTV